jgi:zinc/manganese transport system substrate-binding protein
MKICLATLAGAGALAGLVVLTGCGPGDAAGEPSGRIQVVTSTNVWGNVASAVGGDAVDVVSIVSDPAGDPHSYQMTAKDAAALLGADLIVFNGGGYDEFTQDALSEAADRPPTVEAFNVSSEAGGEGDNEHVWYHLPAVAAVADEVAAKLGELRPASRDSFQANARSFRVELDQLEARIGELAREHGGAKVVATEPVAHYLLDAAKLQDVTPADFVEAIEEESDPPAAAVSEVQNLVAGRQVAALVHNPQTETPVVTDISAKAREANVPVVDLTETLPAGQDYVTWMTEQIDALDSALSKR